jgi:hypothetical protein
MGEEVEVLNSLQRPKKITFFGSDGTSNPFLCKPKDDLRKDSRVMEFNSMINVFLRRNDQARKRELCRLERFGMKNGLTFPSNIRYQNICCGAFKRGVWID